ncbi:MAG: hypothetical protein HETSPECPRED_000919 [Heterodermia speciosa]|uniref:Uncharacterized protein n=1 Tax=Heterodermia speciosa TaxID=116794 RepID=A0A8H3EXZ1_9LECA|nr:MAG: hypothetical protein HETSPECPRED_000919 [Heterodermia speciosa]
MAFPLTKKIPPLLNALTKDIVVRQVQINEIKGCAEVRHNAASTSSLGGMVSVSPTARKPTSLRMDGPKAIKGRNSHN